jgi:hypothetical protein
MTAADGHEMMKQDDVGTAPARGVNPPRRHPFVSLCVSVMGVTLLGYLLGAAVMFFRMPTSDVLAKAFVGARAWGERREASGRAPGQESPPLTAGLIDQPGKTFDGFTLYASAALRASNTRAFLINMRREVVHQWAVPFSRIWPNPSHLPERVDDSLVCFFGCHLYPNGDLLVVLHGLQQQAVGYGLVKLDKDSNVLWSYAANVHHDVDVGPDGTIYAIQQRLVEEMPRGLEYIPTPTLVDSLVLLSPEGKPLKEPIPILEAFRDSPYSLLLSSLERGGQGHARPGDLTGPRFSETLSREDALHTNFVQVLRPELAPKFPAFRAGQVLISLRHLDTIAVMDPDKGPVAWAARGPWRAQHDSQFLDNGHLLIFDNRGPPRGSRVLEYDPQTQAFPWSYAGENWGALYTSERGMSQRLPNGNTLIVNSEGGDILEVTRSKEVVWSCSMKRFITTARRYAPAELPFLSGGHRARPE